MADSPAHRMPAPSPEFTDQVELFLGCGQILSAAITGEIPRGGYPLLHQLTDTHICLLIRYSGRAEGEIRAVWEGRRGATTAKVLTPVDLALATLKGLRGERCRLFVEGGLDALDEKACALFAALVAKEILEGERIAFPLRLFFSVLQIPALLWGRAAEELLQVSAWKSPPFTTDGPEGRESLLDLLFELNPVTLTLFGLPSSKPASKAAGPEPGPVPPPVARRRAAKPEEEAKVCTFETVEDLPAGDQIVLPTELLEELEFATALCARTAKPPLPRLLFHGPPGTGKTHAARVLARFMGRPLAMATAGALINRFIGDSEKALEKAFQEATDAQALLLLDEADSFLFDRRNAVQSHQVSQVNALLHLLDGNAAPVVLCTNFLGSLDEAVHRRIDHLLAFPIPEEADREELWEMELELAGLRPDAFDLKELALLPLTGGLIRNAATQAAKRKLVRGDAYVLDQRALLALARVEEAKMGSLSKRRLPVGFGG